MTRTAAPWVGLLMILPLMALGGLTGCSSSLTAAKGPNQDVELFSDFAAGDPRTDLLAGQLERARATPVRPESPFRVLVTDSVAFDRMRDWRNLAFIGDLSGASWAAQLSRRVFGEEGHAVLIRDRASYKFARNVWADGQTLLFVHAADEGALRRLLADRGERLVDQLADRVVLGLQETLYITGEQRALAEGIAARHGFGLRIPKDFFVEEQAENRFVRLKRIVPGDPVLFLFIYYEDQRLELDDPRMATYCAAIRDTLARVYFGGDRVEPTRTTSRRRTFLEHDALEIYGLYQNDDPPMGGPFRMYAFHAGGRLYLIDLAVFNPPGEKTPQMRTLEAIARTFRLTAEGRGADER